LAPNGQNLYFNGRRNYLGSNDLSLTRGRHNLKLGVWFERVEQSVFSGGQFNAGTANYPTVLAFLQDAPTRFRTNLTPTQMNFRTTQAAWYFQDEIKLRPNLTLRLGLRDEMSNGWNERDARASNYLFDPAGVILTHPNIGKSALIENNALALWQPRVGVAWDPTGTGMWAVRAGFGIHHDLQDNLGSVYSSNPPFNGRVDIDGPLLGDPARGLAPIIPFNGDGVPPSCSALDAQGRNLPAGCFIYSPSGSEANMHIPTVQQWSLTVERELMQDLMLEVGYVGSQSYHVFTYLDMNTIKPVRCENPAGCTNSGGVLPAAQRAGVVIPQGMEYIPVGTRPNRFVGATLHWFFFGTSNYHALNLSLLKRSRGGLTFKSNYSWGKVLDINSANRSGSADNVHSTLLHRWNPKLDKGVAAFSILHQFSTNFSYQLPFGRGKAFGGGAAGWVDKLISGWQWNGIFAAQSGFPITPLAGSNRSGHGDVLNPDVPDRNPNFQGKVIRGGTGSRKPAATSIPTHSCCRWPGPSGTRGAARFADRA
jgi:hypothetical protein